MGHDHHAVSDQAFVAAALHDANAFGPLVRRYEAVLGRYVRRLLGSQSQAAEDVLQEVFIKAYVNLNDFDRARPFAPWIYRIAHNEAMNHIRKTGSGPPLLSGDDASLLIERLADPDDPVQALLRTQTEVSLREALTALDPRYRDVLVLRYLEEKSYDEISDILQLPPGTVATYISRGLKRLREPLAVSWSVA